MSGEQAIFNLQIKKKSGLSLNPDIHHSKVFSSVRNLDQSCQFYISNRKHQTNKFFYSSYKAGQSSVNGMEVFEN